MRRRNQRGFRLILGFPINVASRFEVEGKHKMIRGKTEGEAWREQLLANGQVCLERRDWVDTAN